MPSKSGLNNPEQEFYDEDEPRSIRPGRDRNDIYFLKGSSHPAIKYRYSSPDYVVDLNKNQRQAVFKVISHARGHRALKLMQYVARVNEDQKEIEFEDEMGVPHKGSMDVRRIYNRWEKDFKRARPGLKRTPRHVTHLMFSGDCKNTKENRMKVLNAASETALECIGNKGYDYICCLHEDSGHPHVHLAVNNYNRVPGGKKLKLDPPDLFLIRSKFAQYLSREGLEHVASFRIDRADVVHRVYKGLENIEKQHSLYQRAMRRATPSFDAFSVRRKIGQGLVRLRIQVKKETDPQSEKRQKLLDTIRKTERSLFRESSKQFKKELKATINQFAKESRKYRRNVAMLEHPELSRKKLSTTELSERQEKARQVYQYIVDSIEDSKEYVEQSDITEAEKLEALKAMSKYEKSLSDKLPVSEIYTDRQIQSIANGITRDFNKIEKEKPDKKTKTELVKKIRYDTALIKRVAEKSGMEGAEKDELINKASRIEKKLPQVKISVIDKLKKRRLKPRGKDKGLER